MNKRQRKKAFLQQVRRAMGISDSKHRRLRRWARWLRREANRIDPSWDPLPELPAPMLASLVQDASP